MRLRASTSARPDLSAETIAILLGGFGAAPPSAPAADDEARAFEQAFFELYDIGGPARLWRTHETFLRATAAAWGWTPPFTGPDGVVRFWGEHRAAGYGDDRG